MAIFIAFYTLHCFLTFGVHSEKERGGSYLLQTIFLCVIHIYGFVVLYLREDNEWMLFFCALQEVLFIGIIALYRVLYPEANRLVLNNMCLLLAVGFVMLSRLSMGRALRQFFITVISVGLTLVVPWFMEKRAQLKRYSWLFGIFGLCALLAVRIAGSVTNGSTITYSIGGVTFQPSEFVKIIYVLFLAGVLSGHGVSRGHTPVVNMGSNGGFGEQGAAWENRAGFQPDSGKKGFLGFFKGESHENRDGFQTDAVYENPIPLSNILPAAGLAAAHVAVLVVSRDLGAALIYFIIGLAMIYTATRNRLTVAVGAVLGSVGAVLGYVLFSHVRTRVRAWRDPFRYIDGQGYQITQSLFAIGTGGWFGMGLTMGSPNKIPVVEQDFIFSAISEELGCIFSFCLILICFSTFLMFMNIGMSMRDPFYRLLAVGFATNYIFQVFLTIGGATKFIPLTGVTLPLVSYGGSSILSTLIMFSAVQGIYIMRAKGRGGRA